MSEPRLPSIQGMIFSAPMVQALLAGRKTQTRRILPNGRQPRIRQGDRIYVRETFRVSPNSGEGWPYKVEPCPGWIDYAAGGSHYCHAPDYFSVLKAFGRTAIDWDNLPHRWHSARYMPRWTSRMFLTVIDVRLQQLHAISDDDCIAEGIERDPEHPNLWKRGPLKGDQNTVDATGFPKLAYRSIWEALHNAPGTRWEDNPQVAAYTFTVTHRNIDVLPMAPGYFAEPSPHRQPGLDPGQGFSSTAQPVDARALIEGKVPPHLATKLIRASDLLGTTPKDDVPKADAA